METTHNSHSKPESKFSKISRQIDYEDYEHIKEKLKFDRRIIQYILSLIEYKDKVTSRMKNLESWQLRFPVGHLGSKGNIKKWLTEEEVDLETFEKNNHLQVSATKLPNELVLEMDIEDERLRIAYYNTLKEALKRVGITRYLAIYTGGKSIHYHIFIKLDGLTLEELRYIKEKLVEKVASLFPIDVQVTKDTTPARVPFSYHPETYRKVEIVEPRELNDKDETWFAFEFPKFLESLEIWLPVFDRWLEEFRNKKKEESNVSFSYIGRGKLSKLYYAILRING